MSDKSLVPAGQTAISTALSGSRSLIEMDSPVTISKRAIRGGQIVIGLFLVGLLVFSFLGHMATAVVANGQVAIEGSRQTIQHLEGGIIESIEVKEGQFVKAGQLLIQLDDTRARAQYDLVNDELASLLAEEARLKAERSRADKIIYPAAVTDRADDPKMKAIIDAEENVYSARRTYLEGQQQIAQQRIAQLEETIKANGEQLEAYRQQQSTILKELSSVRDLVAKGLELEKRLLALQRAAADIDRARFEVEGNTAASRQQIGQIQASLADVENQMLSQTVKRLSEVQTNLTDRRNRLAAADDMLNRTRIVAPTDGIVMGMKFVTPGGVIPPGQPIMDLVPSDKQLFVQAQILQKDIDEVGPGMHAEVRLVAYSQRYTPAVNGTVIDVSPDAIEDPNGTTPPYYMSKIMVDSGEMNRLKDVEMKPGMPMQVMIRTGETTLADAVWLPLKTMIALSMTEDSATQQLQKGQAHDRTPKPQP